MKLRYAAFAMVLGSALLLAHREASPAFACTGPGPIETLLDAPVIFEGRVVSVVPRQGAGEGTPYEAPHDITFSVARGYRGVTAGDTVAAVGSLPVPGVPAPCAPLPADFAGQYVVIGLTTGEAGPGELVADPTAMAFHGPEPGGADYQRGVRLAEMITDTGPDAPQLLVDPAGAACGDPIRFVGRRFPPGEYLVRYPFEPRLLGLVTADSNGEFEMSAVLRHSACNRAANNGRSTGVHAYAVRSGPPWEWMGPEDAVEVAAVVISGAVDRDHVFPDAAASPNPAACGAPLTLTGWGFDPGEPLLVNTGLGSPSLDVVAGQSGTFSVLLDAPLQACRGEVLHVRVAQAGFGDIGLSLPVLMVDVFPERDVPGPPLAGTGLAPGQGSRPATALSLIAVGAGLFGAGAALVRFARRD